MAPRACYRTLNLFGGQIKIPVAYYIRSEENKETATKYGYEGESLKQLYVLPKKNDNGERTQTILTPDDIEKIIETDHIQKHVVNENGVLVKVSSIPGLKELMEEHAEKKKQVDIEILGIFDLCDLPFDRFNGRQYYTTSEKAGKKKGNPKDTQLYHCLIEYLKENKKYIHIRYYWNCTTAQEISAMYVKNGNLIISGMYPDFSLRDIPKYNEIDLDKDLNTKLQEKLNKFYCNENIEQENGFEIISPEKSLERQSQKPTFKLDKTKLYTLDWFDYYYEAFTSKNIKRKKEINEIKFTEDNKEDILNILDEI